MADPLLSDDLATVLSVLRQEALTEIVGVLNKNRSFTPFPMPVAKNARKAGADDNLAAHAEEIAREILWWGSNEITRQLGKSPTWRDLLISIGTALEVAAADLRLNVPIHAVEGAILRKAIPDWETLAPGVRAEKVREAGMRGRSALGLIGSLPALALKIVSRFGIWAGAEAGAAGATAGAAAGGTATAAGGTAAASAVMTAAAPIAAAAAAVIGAGYTVFELSGPAYRVVRPVVLLVASSRQRLRDERNASAFAV